MIALSFFTGLFSFIAIVSGSTLLVMIYLDNRNVRIDDGIENFRRHIDALSPEETALLMRPLMEWQGHLTVTAFTFGRGPRQRPLATQNSDGRFVLRPGSIADSESLVDDLVRRALARFDA